MRLIHKIRLFGALGLLLGLSVTATTPSWADPQQEVAQGVVAVDRGDIVDAMRLFRNAAEQGYAPGQLWLAYILDQSEQNEEAVYWYRKAAEQNDAKGQLGLGEMYLKGEGVAQDLVQAVAWVTKAADNGSTDAMRLLALNYQKGGMGLAADLEQARYWLQQAADHGDQWAQQQLSAGGTQQ